MGDVAKSPFLQFFLLLSFSFSLTPSISKTVSGKGLKLCTQVGSDDSTYTNFHKTCKQCSLHVNNNNTFTQYITSGKNHFNEMIGDVGMAGWK